MKLLKLGAPWCSSCVVQEALLKHLNVSDKFEYIDIDKDMETPLKYNVRSIPQLLAIDENDNVVSYIAGKATKEQILDMMERYEKSSYFPL